MTEEKLPPAVQFFDNLEQIEEMKSRRFSNRAIWQKLKSEEKYTGDYTHFCRLMNKEFEDKAVKPAKKRTNVVHAAAQKKEHGNTGKATQSDQANEDQESEDGGPLMFMGDIADPKQN